MSNNLIFKFLHFFSFCITIMMNSSQMKQTMYKQSYKFLLFSHPYFFSTSFNF